MTIVASAGQQSALAIINQTLSDYGLQSLGTWAWQEITQGASADQVLLDMQQQPQFQQRFPGIQQALKNGLNPPSPATYVSYENTMANLEHQYGMPPGMLTDSATVGNFIGNGVSTSEVQERVQQGFAAVAYAPQEVRNAFSSMTGVTGDGALAAYFIDPAKTTTLLTQQATAAQISGQAAIGGIHMQNQDALTLAQMGHTQQDTASGLADLQTKAPLFTTQVGEGQAAPDVGTQGVEAEFGLSTAATQAVQQQEATRKAEFAGGGQAYADQYGASGIGAARPI